MKAAHSPQPPGAFRLVDVDEVGHHAALQQTALRLHPDLRKTVTALLTFEMLIGSTVALGAATVKSGHDFMYLAPPIFKPSSIPILPWEYI